ncbi:SET domain-containing protein [Schizophyllum commune H4-8]|uniref:SET domain-containing protein n=1 Tax=Schizophyllum commune (strain H4-8 / FGSC 9210) TaxID=578458 RepID=UPI00216021C8|nr:SET domain-containing protein [Schizophyllum commune H4-8]KAI5894521.1 SET domain-containing protein [Schizophyllum commune H4-8]
MAPELLRRRPPPWMSIPTKAHGSSLSISFKTDPFLITLPRAVDPHGTCLALLARATYKDLISQPSYPRPVLRPPSILHRVAPAAGAGLGVFAVHDLGAGELVFSERPLLVVPTSVTECEWEACAARLPPAALGALVALADVDPRGGGRPAARRIRTNGVRVPSLCDSGTDYLAVGALSARVNHSCAPNAVLRFDSRALTLELRVLRDVRAGDELRVSYVDAGLPLAARRAALAPWRFACDCSCCASGDAGDTLRARIRVPDLRFISSPAVGIQRCVLQLMQLERAGLEVLGAYGTCLGLLAGLYGRIGDRRKAKEYKRKTDAWTYAVRGEIEGRS